MKPARLVSVRDDAVPHGRPALVTAYSDTLRAGAVLLSVQVDGVAVTASLGRDSVDQLAHALEDWLSESRPA